MARYLADKLQLWALSLMSFRYTIEHVPGDENAWGDLLSRWGAEPVLHDERTALRVARLAVVERVSPLEELNFVWPSTAETKALRSRLKLTRMFLPTARCNSTRNAEFS
jgi:hypothetical protein